VAGKDVDRNVLQIAQGEHPSLFNSQLSCSEIYFIDPETAPSENEVLGCKTRYRQADQACRVHRNTDSGWTISFDQPQRAITPGQYAVLYRGDHCLGGGIINGAIDGAAN
jgi:tRNA-specific 2-thiouridylase